MLLRVTVARSAFRLLLLTSLFATCLAQTIIVVDFQQSLYSVDESAGKVQVQLVTNQPSPYPFSVTCLVSEPDSAMFGDLTPAVLITHANLFGDYLITLSDTAPEDMFTVEFRGNSSISEKFLLEIADDNIREGTEYFQMQIVDLAFQGSDPPETILQPGPNSQVLVTIRDDDIVQVKFTDIAISLDEGSSVELKGETSGSPFSNPIDIGVICFPLRARQIKSAMFVLDYNYTEPLELIFLDTGRMETESASGPVIDAVADNCVEGSESFICAIQVGVSPGDTIQSVDPDTITIEIIDQDELILQWKEPFVRVRENVGSFPAVLVAVGRFELSFILHAEPQLATNTVISGLSLQQAIPFLGSFTGDYSDLDATYSFSGSCNAETTEDMSVFFIENDNILEEDEVFELVFSIPIMLSRQINVKAGAIVIMSVIIEDDDDVSVVFSEGDCVGSEVTGVASFNLEVQGKYYIDFQVEVECRGGSATVEEDFVIFRKMLNISRPVITTQPYPEVLPNTTLSQPFFIEIVNDTVVEQEECFVCEILSTSHPRVLIGARSITSCCITDEDRVIVQFSKNTESGLESSGSIVFEVELIGSTSFPISVEVATMDLVLPPGTGAIGDIDYHSIVSTLTFPPTNGRSVQTFTVDLIDDEIPENSELFGVLITRIITSNPRIIIGNPSNGTGEILNDDAFVSIGLDSQTYSVVEGDGKVTVCVNLTNSYFEPIFVQLTPLVIPGGGLDSASMLDFDSTAQTVTIGVGDSQGCADITIIDEELLEFAEDFVVAISYTGAQEGVSLSGQDQATVTIRNDDAVELRLGQEVYMTAEGSVVEVTVIASNMASFAYSFNVLSVDGTALAGLDYDPVSLNFNYVGGSSSLVYAFNVSVLNDALFEGEEEFQLSLSVPAEFELFQVRTALPNVSTVRIDDSNTVSVQFDPTTYTVSEGGSTSITIVSNTTVDAPVSITVAIGGGTATDGSDYTSGGITRTVVIPAGSNMATLVIATSTDNLIEGTEDFFVMLVSTDSPLAIIGSESVATVDILDTTEARVSFLTVTPLIAEGSVGNVVLFLEGGVMVAPGVTFVVNVIQRNGTAMSPGDFIYRGIEVTFLGGSNAASFIVGSPEDMIVEGTETFFLDLSISSPEAISLNVKVGSRPTATVTILDNDIATVAFTTAAIEVGEADAEVCVGIEASLPKSVDYTVEVVVTSGSAQDGTDFFAAAGPISVLVPALQTSASVCITIIPDGLLEGSENFTLTLVVPAAADRVSRGTPYMTAVTILDDDTVKVSLSSDKVEMMEGSSSTISVEVDGDSAIPFTVTLNAIPDTADSNDFGGSFPISITFNPGETSFDVDLTAISDGIIECNERYQLVLEVDADSAAVGVELGDIPEADVLIEDPDGPLEVVVDPGNYQVVEGEKVNITLKTNSILYSFPFSVSLMFTNTTATQGSDYVAQPTTVSFSPGEEQVSFQVTTVDDDVAELTEAFQIVVTGVSGDSDCDGRVVVGSEDDAVVTIMDNDDVSVVFSEGDCVGSEVSGVASFNLEVQGKYYIDFQVEVECRGGSATAGEDFVMYRDTLTFMPPPSASRDMLPSTTMSQAILVEVVNDTVVEQEECFVCEILSTSHPSAVIGARSNTSCCVIDEDRVIIQFSQNTGSGLESSGSIVFEVELIGSTSFPISVEVATMDLVLPPGTGAIGGIDYHTIVSTLTFPPTNGRSVQTFTVDLIDDEIPENSELFGVLINRIITSNPRIIIGNPSTGTGEILNDDAFVSIGLDSQTYSVVEGDGKVTVCVNLTNSYFEPISVQLTPLVIPGGGLDSASMLDIDSTPQTVTIGVGDSQGCADITIIDEEVLEFAEDFVVAISYTGAQEGVSLSGQDQATVTIRNDDAVELRLEQEVYMTAEGSVVEVTVIASNMASFAYSFNVLSVDGTALAGLDFDAVNLIFNYAGGSSTLTHGFEVTILDDTVLEDIEETFTLELSVPDEYIFIGLSTGSPDVSTVQITDDDFACVQFDPTTHSVSEGGSASIVIVSNATVDVPVTITVTIGGGTATDGSDYTSGGVTRTVVIPAGSNMATLVFPTSTDNLIEGTETFMVTFGAVIPDRVSVCDNAPATVSILDGTPAVVSFLTHEVSIPEGSTSVLVLTLEGGVMVGPGVSFTVDIIPRNGTAEGPGDFNPAPIQATFAGGSSSTTIPVTALGDNIVEGGENFFMDLNISSPEAISLGVTVGSSPTATVTIGDDDVATVAFTTAAIEVGEADAEVCVGIEASLPKSVDYTVEVVVTSGSAQDGTDFIAAANPIFVLVPALQTSASVCIPIIPDGLLEGSENFTLTLVVPAAADRVSRGTPYMTAVTILDDDTVKVSLSSDKVEMMEGSSSTISVEVDGDSAIPFTVTLNAIPDTADSNDFGGSFPISITFNPGETSFDVDLTAISDGIIECNERYKLVLEVDADSAAVGVELGDIPEADVLIEDADGPLEVVLDQVNYEVVEGEKVNVTLRTNSNLYSFPFTVTLMFTALDLTQESDYVAQPTTVSFSPGEEQVSFEVTTVDDDIADLGAKAFQIDITGVNVDSECVGNVVVGSDDDAIVTIIDNDDLVVSLTPLVKEAPEGNTVTFTVSTNIPFDTDFDVIVSLQNGSALHGLDFTSLTNLVLTFPRSPDAPSSQIVSFDLLNDRVVEGPETFQVSLTAPVGNNDLEVSDDVATVTIIDNTDVEVLVSIGPITEGQTASLTLTLPDGYELDTSLNFTISTMNGTAQAGTDYIPLDEMFVFMEGSTTLIISIPSVDDSFLEPVEDFKVSIIPTPMPGVMVTVNNPEVTVQIHDNDIFSIGFAEPMYTVDESSGTLTVTVVADMTTIDSFSFFISLGSGTADSSSDFDINLPMADGQIGVFNGTFPPGATMITFTIDIVDDLLFEGPESVVLELSVGDDADDVGVTVGSMSITTVTIVDNEPVVVVEFEMPNVTVPEGAGSVEVCLIKTANGSQTTTTNPIMVVVVVQKKETPMGSGSGLFPSTTDETDFDENSAPAMVQFLPNETRVCFNVSIVNDTIDEPDESFEVVIVIPPGQPGVASGEVNSTAPDPLCITILDDDVVMVSFEEPTYTVIESDGVLMVTIVADGNSSEPFDVEITASPGSATGDDFTFPSTIVTFEPGETVKIISITITDDDMIAENNETFTLTLSVVDSDPERVTEGAVPTTEVTIVDLTPINVSFDPTTYTVDEGGNATITIVIDIPSSEDITITITCNNGSATGPDDFNTDPVVVIIPAGETSVTFDIPTVDDDVTEPTENFSISITDPSDPRIVPGEDGVITILDTDMLTVSFEEPTYTVIESNGVLMVTIVADGTSSQPFDVEITASPGSATGDDFTFPSTIVTFEPGETVKIISITITDDDMIAENNETFTLTLSVVDSDPERVTDGAVPTTEVTIVDLTPINVSFDPTTYTVDEGGNATITIVIDIPSSEDITITITCNNGSATGPDDFNTDPVVVIIPAGETSVTFDIPTVDDDVTEPTENFTISITDPSDPRIVPGEDGVITILDTDMVTVSFEEPTYTVIESDGVLTVTIVADGTSSQPFDVEITASPGSATGADFTFPLTTVTFQPGETEKIISVTIANDMVAEPNETFSLSLSVPASAPANIASGAVPTAEVTIVDLTPINVSFDPTTYTVDEGGNATITIVIDIPSSEDITITITCNNGSATGPDDFNTDPVVVIIPAGETSVTFDIPTVDDDVTEPTENFSISITDPSDPRIVPGEDGVITILDTDMLTVSFEEPTYTVIESNGVLMVTIVADGTSSQPFDVEITASPGSATDDDFTFPLTTVTFQPGETEKIISVTIANDMVAEPNETFSLSLSVPASAPSNIASGAVPTTEVTIVDLTPINVSFDPTTYTVGEGENATITIVIDIPSSEDITITITPTDGSATGPDDFNPAPVVVIIPAGETTVTVDIPTVDDDVTEPTENFSISITDPSDPRIVPGEDGIVIIEEEDGVLTVSFEEPTYTVIESDGVLTVTIVADGTSSQPFDVEITASPGSATGADFTFPLTTVTFQPGETEKIISVTIANDMVAEPNETFSLSLSVPASAPANIASGAVPTAEVTIVDLTPINVSFDPTTYTVDEGGNATITIVIDIPSSEDITITITCNNGSATGPDDFNTDPVVVIIPAGETSVTFDIPTVDDDVTEPTENFSISITDPSDPRIVPGEDGVITILDTDMLTVSFEEPTYTVIESNGVLMVTIVADGTSSQPFDVEITASPGSATGDDFTFPLTTVTFQPGETEKIISVTIANDMVAEPNETFSLSLSVPASAPANIASGAVPTTEVTIVDLTPINVSFDPTTYTVGEGENATITIVIDIPSSEDITITITPTDGSATGPDDFNPAPVVVIIPAGETTVTVDIPTVDDDVTEPTENFSISITDPSDPRIVPGEDGIVIIEEEDGVVTVSFEEPTYTVIESDGVLTVTIVADGTSSQPFDVEITASPGSATGADFTFPLTTVTFQPGETEKIISVTIANDMVAEPNETFSLSLSVPASAPANITEGAVPTTEVTIVDLTPINVSFDPTTYTVDEGENATITIVIDIPSSEDITITITPTDGSATGPDDFNPAPVVVIIPAGETTVTVDIPTVDDDATEPTENFSISITDPSDPRIVPGEDGIVIIEEEDGVVTVSFEEPTYTVIESDGVLTVTIVADGTSSQPFDVEITASPGSATGDDFTFPLTTVTFQPGETEKIISVTIANDMVAEPNETFSLSLSVPASAPANITEGAVSTTEVTIVDLTPINVSFDPTTYTVGEGENATITIVIDIPSSEDITITITPTDGSATGPDDFNPAPVVVIIPAGETTVTVDIPTVDDNVTEPTENFSISITDPSDPRIVPGEDGVIIIEEESQLSSVVVVQFRDVLYEVGEGSGMVRVYLDVSGGMRMSPFVVILTLHNGTATGPGDFTGSTFEVNVNPRDSSVSQDILILDDDIIEGLENFTISLTIPPSATALRVFTGNRNITTVNIIDDDLPINDVVVQFRDVLYAVGEGDGEVTVYLDVSGGMRMSPFVVILTLHNGTATASEDFSSKTFEVIVNPRDSSASQAIVILDDDIIEGLEHFTISLTIPPSATALGVVPGDRNVTTVNIIDDDSPPDEILFSFGLQNYTVIEDEGPLIVHINASRPSAIPYTITIIPQPNTAQADSDFDPTPITVTINPGETSATFMIPITDDSVVESNETFHLYLNFSQSAAGFSAFTTVTILDDDVPSGMNLTFVNDTIIGDPLFTIPLPDGELTDISLCMEFHGLSDKYYNLVSDSCTTVNAHYAQGLRNPRLHIIDEVGVKTEGEGGQCHQVLVSLDQCKTFVDGSEISGMVRVDGLTVVAVPQRRRTRISLPNCSPGKELVMWVSCDIIGSGNLTEDMLQYTLSRAIGLDPTSHGLIAQFWNVPIEYSQYVGPFGDETVTADDRVYSVTVSYPQSEPRTFLAELSNIRWDHTLAPCLYAGNRLGGASYEGREFGSVIEGRHSDYEVPDALAHEFIFDKYTSSC